MATYPIKTTRLQLRPFQASDLTALHAYYGEPAVVRYLYTGVQNREEAQATLRQRMAESSWQTEGTRLTLAVIRNAVGSTAPEALIGEVTLIHRSVAYQQAELGYVFHPAYGGQGYATEAVMVLLALGFGELNLHRIFARCDARNEPSYRLMERVGMRREAHFRHNEFFKGEWGDEFVYALLQEEWQARIAVLGEQQESTP